MEVFVIGHEVMQAQKLKELLFEVDESIRIVGISETIGAAMDWLHRNRIPDIIPATDDYRFAKRFFLSPYSMTV